MSERKTEDMKILKSEEMEKATGGTGIVTSLPVDSSNTNKKEPTRMGHPVCRFCRSTVARTDSGMFVCNKYARCKEYLVPKTAGEVDWE